MTYSQQPATVPIQSLMNPAHTLPLYLPYIPFNIIQLYSSYAEVLRVVPFLHVSLRDVSFLQVCQQIFVHISHLSDAPLIPSFFILSSKQRIIWCRVRTMKIFIMQFFSLVISSVLGKNIIKNINMTAVINYIITTKFAVHS